jgi:hypothetical protein
MFMFLPQFLCDHALHPFERIFLQLICDVGEPNVLQTDLDSGSGFRLSAVADHVAGDPQPFL